MSLSELLHRYQNNPSLFQLADRLSFVQTGLAGDQSAFQPVILENLQGSSAQFVVAAMLLHPSLQALNHILLMEDAEQAAYFHNSLENLVAAPNPLAARPEIFYFPGSFKKQKDFSLLNPSHVVLRTEALTKIAAGGNKKVIVTCPEALLEKVLQPGAFAHNIIRIKTGDSLEVEQLLMQLSDYGFERCDFVYEPGQFAIRGGILDIYSFGNEKPYRVELYGRQVESVRIIDPETQLSERKLLQVDIIPNLDAQLKAEPKISLLDFLPHGTVIWMQGADRCFHRMLEFENDVQSFLRLREVPAVPELKSTDVRKRRKDHEPEQDDVLRREVTEADFVTAVQMQDDIAKRQQLFIGYGEQIPGSMPAYSILFSTREQPAFNRQFDYLVKNLKELEEKKYSIYIFADNPRQLERLQSIFDDLNAGITFHPVAVSIHEGFVDDDLKLVCYTDHQIFQRYHKYRVRQAYNKNKALTMRTLRELQPGDYVTHIDHGVGVFSGLQKIDINGRSQEAVRLMYKDNDILYVNINSLHKIARYTGKEGHAPRINKLGTDTWNRLKEKTKTRVKELAFDLIKLYAKRKAQHGFPHSPDNYLQTELEASFIFEDTPDQAKATADVKKDMGSPSPMDRLVCGDVGFGKTEVAIRAAFKTCVDGKQAAVLVPTTILAFQHFKTFSERLKDFPVKVDYINRFKSAKEKKETLKQTAEGKVDILIGTHALLGKDVIFKDLGLLVVDEEQKFGVGHKEKIKTLRSTVDCLTLTATPIPRTLQFSLMGARDLSIINTAPANRQPIQTEVHVYNEDLIRDAVYFETERGGQVFFIFNRIAGLGEMAGILQALCPDLSIGYAHGQMEGHDLEERILDFIDKKYDVLVCTNIVESGVDIPNVNTIIVHNAHQFGLSDLHQLRGRVGRSNKKAFCYLLAPPMSTLPVDSRRRLQTLEQHSDLGSGFQIAMRDLDIRGAGNLLGGEQSGFMAEIGFEMYHKILDEAIRELKRTDFKDLFQEEISRQDDFVQDCTIDTDLEILIPDEYIGNIPERLSVYQRLDNCETEEELAALRLELTDRFGPVPAATDELFITIRCRKLAVELGFEKMSLKDDTLRCFFIHKPNSPYFESATFQQIINYLQTATNKARLKQAGKLFQLTVAPLSGMQQVFDFLSSMHRFCFEQESPASA